MQKRFIFFTSLFLILSVAFLSASGKQEKNDKMVIRIADQVPNLITPGSWDGQTFSMNSSIYDWLVDINAKTRELSPSLATSWSSEDGKTWTVKLREGVKFHDGSDFTSADVKYTVERTQDPDLGHLKQKDFAIVESIDTPDDYTVVFHLAEVRPTFMYLFSDYNMAMLASDYDYASLGETKPMGTGAFKLQQLVPKESALLVKNTNYWAPEYPKADELRIYFVPDTDTAVSMLETGKVDVVPFVSTLQKKKLEQNDNFKVVVPYQEMRYVALAQDREPFNDNRVRLAMKYTIDPEILAKACQGELGVDVNYNETPIMNILSQYKDLPMREQNIAKAKELLADAGYSNGVTVDLYYASDHPYVAEIAQALKELAAPAGFNIKLNGFPRDIYLSQYWMNGPMLITGWGPRVDPSMLLMLAYYSEGPWNESHMDNPKVDALIQKIKTEVDDVKRQQYYDELQKIFHDEGTVLNVQVPYYVAMRKEVQDYRQPLTMLTQYKYTYIK